MESREGVASLASAESRVSAMVIVYAADWPSFHTGRVHEGLAAAPP
jgi:hypothetical protein